MNSTEHIGIGLLAVVASFVVSPSVVLGESFVAKTEWKYDVQSEDAAKARDRLFDALRIHQGDSYKDACKVDIDVLLQEISSLTNKLERDAIFAEFEDRLFSFDPSNLDYAQQENIIDDTWHTSFLLRCAIKDATTKKLWGIRLKALAWVRHQTERVENNEPEDRRTWPQKWGNVYVKGNMAHNQWERTRKTIRKNFQGYIKRCATDIENERYSDEFRKWAQKEMEKIIGRPLTDDDLWSIGIEWREERSKKRAQKAGGAGADGN